MTTRIDNYFADKGIKVRYNALGHDETLIKAFVYNFQNEVDSSSGKSSQYIKDKIYSCLYPIKPRTKLTGFEKSKKMDIGFRGKMTSVVPSIHFTPLMTVDKTTEFHSVDYKDALKNSLKTIENPLLYLSGGIDSELVCLALLDADIQFQTVMFEWVDDTDFILNEEDLSFAREFCKVHNISPIVERVNIQSLWQSSEFEQMSIDLGIISPQIVTHAYSIQLMSEKLPDVTHVFGGEVRFHSDYLLDDGEQTNLVYLDKVIPPGYSGVSYTASANGGGFGIYNLGLDLQYDGSTGYWFVIPSNYNSTSEIPSGSPYYGQWTTTPTSSYQYRITAVSGSGLFTPSVAPTAWVAVPSFGDTIVAVGPLSIEEGGGSQVMYGNFTIQVRVTGVTNPAQFATSTISFTIAGAG